jgi:hypothetical protein
VKVDVVARLTHIWKTGVVVAALLATVVACGSSDSSRARNAALVAGTSCVKPGAVTKVSKVSVVCAKTTTGNIWYPTMKAKGKAQACVKPGIIRKKSQIVWVCGVVKSKKLWQATQPLTALSAKGDLLSTSPGAFVVADNAVLADPKIPDDKTVTQVPDAATTPTLAPAVTTALSLVTQPLGGVNADVLKTQPVVQLLDQRGASIATAGITITAVSGRTDVVLSGNTAITDATGRATFTTLSLKGIMGDITLTFTASGLEGITSDKFVLAAGAATRLVNSTTSSSVASGKAFDQQPVLHLEDSSANVIAVSGVDVIVTSSPPGLIGTTTVATNKNGIAEFTGLALTQAGVTTLTFTSGLLSTKPKVTVVAGDYTTVKITTEASVVASNNNKFSQSPVVQLIDANDNNVITKDITVTATITQFPTADTNKVATLLVSTATTNDQGQATFTGLGIKGLIGDYTLGYTPTNGVTEVSKKTTTLSAGGTTQLIVLTAAAGPVGNSTEGTWSLTQSPVIGLRDISNNPVPTSGVAVTATVNGQTSTTAPTTALTNAEGEAPIGLIFSGDSAGDRTIRYSALSLQTDSVTINLPLLNTEVSPAWVLQKRIKSSAPFVLTPPTSNSSGAWSYASSNTAIATVTSAGLVTLLGLAGQTSFTATQAATSKYKSATTTANLVTTDSYNVGDTGPGGGIVFYDAGATQSWGRYLEAALTNGTTPSTWTPNTQAQWGCNSTFITGTSLEIGTGRANTKMITGQGCKGTDNSMSAASIAAAYNGGGKTDWFLPSRDELNELCKYAKTQTTGDIEQHCVLPGTIRTGFASDNYWSSSELDKNYAWYQSFSSGFGDSYSKGSTFYVRPVRAFAATCAEGGPCIVGDTGPGGGTVFYVTTTPFKCGVDLAAECTYLEAAPTGWITASTPARQTNCATAGTSTVDPKCGWSGNTVDRIGTTGTGIGTGYKNTSKMITQLSGGSTAGKSATVARAFQGGGKTDWSLPSRDELNELCKIYSNGRTDTTGYRGYQNGCTGNTSPTGGFASDTYWSSSEFAAGNAWFQSFLYGGQFYSNKAYAYYVRPVRAFAATCAEGGPCIVGDTGPGGGTVFYVTTTPFKCGVDLAAECTYLEAAPTGWITASTPARQTNCATAGTSTVDPKCGWSGNTVDRIGTTGTGIGTGYKNTSKMITQLSGGSTAGKSATVARAFQGGGKTDWSLPSRDELNELCKIYSNGRTDTTGYRGYQNGCTGNTSPTGGFASGGYWSSSEGDANYAWFQYFYLGTQDYNGKSLTRYVRPVRAF